MAYWWHTIKTVTCSVLQCQCDKDINEYYKLECCSRECENLIDKAIPPVENIANKKVNVY